jgi:hypothetical protein
MLFRNTLLACVLAGSVASTCLAAQDADDASLARHHAKHVLLISVDGMHAIDLTNYVSTHPDSTLAELTHHGIVYDNNATSTPSDSFPGLAALLTGGSPSTTGFWYDVTYNRRLSPPSQTTPYGIVGSPTACPSVQGTQIGFDEEIDRDYTKLNGGGGINPRWLPRDPARGCAPVYPHEYLRVNTVFEVAKAAGLYTAWSDKHPSYEWVNGPSGKGVDDFYSPEINSIPVALPGIPGCDPLPDPANATPSNAWTDSIQNIQCYDTLKVNAILHEIDGKTHDGRGSAPVPAIFGMNFQAVSVGQKLKGNGYYDVTGTPSVGLASEFDFVDQSLGRIVSELKQRGLWGSTVIIIGAKHGQSPIDAQKVTKIPGSTPQNVIGPAYAFDISDDGSLIWLKDPSLIADVLPNLATPSAQEQLGIQEIFAGTSLRTRWNNPESDERTPDIILKANTGVIFTGGSKIAEHGGLNEDDYHVALLISGAGVKHRVVKSPTSNQQVAPTILQILGLDPNKLQAVQKEGTPVLPFLQ